MLFFLLSLVVGVYLIACLMYYFLQTKLLFKRTLFNVDFPFHYEFPFEELFWNTNDGNKLNGLWFKQTESKGVILFLHGNSGHMGRSGNYFKRVKEFGYDVVMYDYRGYGKSSGYPTQQSFYNDAIVVFDWLKQQYPNSNIIIHGLSLGSHIACYLSSKRSVNTLILETPFLNLKNIAKYKYPWLPSGLLLRYKLNSSVYLPQIHCSIYIIHGDCDTVVPLSEPQKFSNFNNNVTLNIIKGGNHKNLHDFSEYKKILENIFKN